MSALAACRLLEAEASTPPATTPTPNDSTTLRAALEQLQSQNAQLRSTLGVMREEMEALQQAAAVAAEVAAAPAAAPVAPLPEDVALLTAELQESDRDLQHALEHIAVLQRQLDSVQRPASAKSGRPSHMHARSDGGDAACAADSGMGSEGHQDEDSRPGSAPVGQNITSTSGRCDVSSELGYLRTRVHALAAENRQLRRLALQLRLAAGEQAGGKTAGEHGTAAASGEVTGGGGNAAGQTGAAGSTRSTGGGSIIAQDHVTIPGAMPSSTAGEQGQGSTVPHGQYASAVREAARLRSENEKLMEMSNALR